MPKKLKPIQFKKIPAKALQKQMAECKNIVSSQAWNPVLRNA